MLMHPDSRLPNEMQRRKLCELLHVVFVDIRNIAGSGAAQQASDLADAFHNLPHEIWAPYFSFSYFRKAFLDPYSRTWSEAVGDSKYHRLLAEAEALA